MDEEYYLCLIVVNLDVKVWLEDGEDYKKNLLMNFK